MSDEFVVGVTIGICCTFPIAILIHFVWRLLTYKSDYPDYPR